MKTRPGLLLALVLALVAGAYLNALSVGFVWDDRVVVLSSRGPADGTKAGGSGESLASVMTRPFWGESSADEEIAPYFRPVTSASFALDRALYGDNPAGFHLTSVLLHLLACGLLFAVCRRFGAPPLAALLATLAFGSDARLTESVTWVSGRTDVLAADFALAALLVWPRADSGRGHAPDLAESPTDEVAGFGGHLGARIAGALLFAGAVLAKETALVVPLALAWTETAVPSARLRRWSPVLAALAASFALRTFALAHASALANTAPRSDRAIASVEAVGRYAVMLLDPWQPRLQIGLVTEHAPLFVGLGALVLVILLVAFRGALGEDGARSRSRLAAGERFGLALAMLATLLVLPLGPARISVVAADRFLYLPLLGLAVALSIAVDRLSAPPPVGAGASGGKRRGIVLASVSFAWALSSLAVVPGRNALWADELGLWLETSETAAAEDTIRSRRSPPHSTAETTSKERSRSASTPPGERRGTTASAACSERRRRRRASVPAASSVRGTCSSDRRTWRRPAEGAGSSIDSPGSSSRWATTGPREPTPRKRRREGSARGLVTLPDRSSRWSTRAKPRSAR